MTLEMLCMVTGISLATLERLMRGEKGITLNQLGVIARYFNRGLLFFLEADAVNEQLVYSTQFRTLTNQKTDLSPRIRALIERAEEKRAIYISLLEDLGEEVDTKWEVPDLNMDRVKESAARVREWLGLDDKGTFALFRERLQEKGILVFVSNSYRGDWHIEKEEPVAGFSLYYPSYPVIFIKKQGSEARQAFTLMHELGHLMLHRESYIDDEENFYSYRQKEKAANEFAGNMLVPNEFLAGIDMNRFPLNRADHYHVFLRDHSKKWGVSTEVILRRLLDEGIIQKRHYQDYKEWQKSLPEKKGPSSGSRYRYKEPVRMFGVPYVETVFNALNARNISLAKASSYLDGLKIADIHKLAHVPV